MNECSNNLDLGERIDKILRSTAVAFKKSNPYWAGCQSKMEKNTKAYSSTQGWLLN